MAFDVWYKMSLQGIFQFWRYPTEEIVDLFLYWLNNLWSAYNEVRWVLALSSPLGVAGCHMTLKQSLRFSQRVVHKNGTWGRGWRATSSASVYHLHCGPITVLPANGWHPLWRHQAHPSSDLSVNHPDFIDSVRGRGRGFGCQWRKLAVSILPVLLPRWW